MAGTDDQSGQAREGDAPGGWLVGNPLFAVLARDIGNSVTIFDRTPRIVFASRRVIEDYTTHARQLGVANPRHGAQIIGARLPEILPERFAREREAFIREVFATGTPLVYESVLRGIRQRVAVRRIEPPAGHEPLVSLVARPLVGSEEIEQTVGDGEKLVSANLHDRGVLAKLTAREIEVLTLIGEGLSAAEIARRLHRSVRTVEGHRERIGAKLGVANRVELARLAIRAGLCELPMPVEQPEGE